MSSRQERIKTGHPNPATELGRKSDKLKIERQEESVVSRVRVVRKIGREKRKKKRKKKKKRGEGIFGYPIVGLGLFGKRVRKTFDQGDNPSSSNRLGNKYYVYLSWVEIKKQSIQSSQMRKMRKKGRKDVITFVLVYPDGHGNRYTRIYSHYFQVGVYTQLRIIVLQKFEF